MEEALQITQLITNIIIILLFLGLVILLFGVIKQIKKISAKIENLSKDISDVKPKVTEAIDKINSISDNVNSVVKKVNDNMDILGTVVDRFKDTADSIIDFEKKIQSKIEPPVMDTLNTISAVSVGVKTFMDSWKNKRKSNVNDHNSDPALIEIQDSIGDVNKELEEINTKLSDMQK